MFDRHSEFFSLSKEVVERFLQSAVIVDDGAAFDGGAIEKPLSELVTPDRHHRRLADVDIPERTASDDAEAADASGRVGRLDAKKVIDSFARKGIVCSVLRPRRDEVAGLADTVERLASCADIIILDWTLHKDAGKTAQEMIERIARSSIGSPGQLRLIAVYTVAPGIIGISQTIKGILVRIADANEEGSGATRVHEEDDGLTLVFGAARITVLAKHETAVPRQYVDHVVPFEQLADRVVEEFTAMTAGLVSNVVLQAMAQLRRNTHRILGQFSVDLDAPYLTHRALLKHPVEAEDHLTALAAEELQAILEEAQVGGKANSRACRVWLKAKEDAGRDFTLRWPRGGEQPEERKVTAEELSELLKVGLEAWECGDLPRRIREKGHKLLLTRAFQADEAGPHFLDEKFAFATTMRAYYEQTAPKLTLGTIINGVSERSTSYWICIQPPCDCVRIDAIRAFPFLPLRIAEDDDKFNYVIREDDGYVRLLIRKRPYELESISFCPCRDGVIAARKQDEAYYFVDTHSSRYRWIGELRRNHAQRLSNEFAAALCRVGLDESEWLRLWAKG